jgi:hypothetical protein
MADAVNLSRDLKAKLRSIRRAHERTRRALQQRKRRFDAAHAAGMKALETGNMKALDAAVKEETRLIREQTSSTRSLRPNTAKKKR